MKVTTICVMALVAMVSAKYDPMVNGPHHQAHAMAEHEEHAQKHPYHEARSHEHEVHEQDRPHHEARSEHEYEHESLSKVDGQKHPHYEFRSEHKSEQVPTQVDEHKHPHYKSRSEHENKDSEHKRHHREFRSEHNSGYKEHKHPHYESRSEHKSKPKVDEPHSNSPKYTHRHIPLRAARRALTGSQAISNIRNILTGSTGIHSTCDRCVAAMKVGQQLAQQSPDAFSSAVVGLCKAVRFRGSNSACANDFSSHKVQPYISTLANANIVRDGKDFCKAYFQTCE